LSLLGASSGGPIFDFVDNHQFRFSKQYFRIREPPLVGPGFGGDGGGKKKKKSGYLKNFEQLPSTSDSLGGY
jgi:hypothetical protein